MATKKKLPALNVSDPEVSLPPLPAPAPDPPPPPVKKIVHVVDILLDQFGDGESFTVEFPDEASLNTYVDTAFKAGYFAVDREPDKSKYSLMLVPVDKVKRVLIHKREKF